MTRYTHDYMIGFSVKGSKCPNASDVTEQMLQDELLSRVTDLIECEEVGEAVEKPQYTEKEE